MTDERDPMVVKVEGLKPETAQAVYDLTKEAPEKQILSATSLDTKMVQIFGAASIVMGFLGLSSSNDLASGRSWVLILLAIALASYVCTAVAAFWHLKPRRFWRNLEVSRWLTPKYQNLDDDDFRRLAIVDTAHAYLHNGGILKTKARCLCCALASTAIEVFMVAVALVIYRLA